MNQNKHFKLKLIWDYEGLCQILNKIRISKNNVKENETLLQSLRSEEETDIIRVYLQLKLLSYTYIELPAHYRWAHESKSTEETRPKIFVLLEREKKRK